MVKLLRMLGAVLLPPFFRRLPRSRRGCPAASRRDLLKHWASLMTLQVPSPRSFDAAELFYEPLGRTGSLREQVQRLVNKNERLT